MKTILYSILLLAWGTSVFAQFDPPTNYYSSANGLTGSALENALHNIIDDHNKLNWNDGSPNVWTALEALDQDPSNSNNILSIYTNRSIPKSAKDGYGTGAAYEWNREHIFPKSKGFDNRSWPAYNDLHSLAASQDNVNNARGNKPFDNGGSQNYQAVGTSLWNRADSDSWETWDNRKGDVARAIFYMAVRYSGDKSNETDLKISDLISEATTGSNKMAKLSTLIQWHLQDPPDTRERERNHKIYTTYQYNRNPFVDNPTYVQAIWGGGSNPPTGGNTLTSGQAVSGSISQGQWVHYTIQLPSNATGLTVAMTGTGDADLYTRYNAQPTSSQYDYRPYIGGSNETVTYPTVVAGGTYHISVYGYATSSTYSLTATVSTGSTGGGTPPSGNSLTSGQSVSGSVAQGAWVYYTIQLPSNATGLTVAMTGTGDADLYTRYNAQPTSSQYDYRPYIGGSNETVTYPTVVAGGTYHIGVNGYATSSSYSLTATVTTGTTGGGGTPPPSGGNEIAAYTFESGSQGWTNPDGTYGWRRDSGTTPSGSTGPSVDQTLGTTSGYHYYMESSSNQGPYVSSNPPSYLVSPDISGSDRSVEFYYHMYGSTMGTLHLDVSTNGGSTWTSVWSKSGQQHTSMSAPWTKATVNLGAYSGTIKLRFRGVSTASSSGWKSDMAVDSIRILGSADGGGSGGTAQLVLVRALPNPDGSDSYAEAFEIRNDGTATANLSDYRVRDNSGSTNWASLTGTVSPGQTRQFVRTSSSDFILTNSSDTLRLQTSSGTVLDSISWSSAASGVWYQ